MVSGRYGGSLELVKRDRDTITMASTHKIIVAAPEIESLRRKMSVRAISTADPRAHEWCAQAFEKRTEELGRDRVD